MVVSVALIKMDTNVLVLMDIRVIYARSVNAKIHAAQILVETEVYVAQINMASNARV